MLRPDSRAQEKARPQDSNRGPRRLNIKSDEPNVKKPNVKKPNVKKPNVNKPNASRAKPNVRIRNLMLRPDFLTLGSFVNIKSAGAQISDSYRPRKIKETGSRKSAQNRHKVETPKNLEIGKIKRTDEIRAGQDRVL